MAKDIEVNLVGNSREFTTSVERGGDALKKMDRELSDVADSSRDIERLEDDFRDLGRAAERAGDDIGDGVGRGFDKAKAGADDFKSEAKQSGTEAAASFSGEFEDVGDFIQETVANGLGGFGPIGAVAGIALAAGIGVFANELTKQAEAAEERIGEMYDDFIDSGLNYLSTQYLINETQKLLGNEEGNRYDEITKAAKTLGLSVQEVALAYAGQSEAIDFVAERANILANREREAAGSRDKYAKESVSQYSNIANALEEVGGATDTARKQAEEQRAAVDLLASKYGQVEEKAGDAADAASKIQSKNVTITADDSQFIRTIRRLQDGSYQARVTVNGVTRNGARFF